MRRSVFIPALLLAVIFVLAKVAIIWPVNSLRQVENLLLVSGQDVAAAVGFGLVAGGALWLAARIGSRHPFPQRFVWAIILLIGAIASLYAVVNVGVYRY